MRIGCEPTSRLLRFRKEWNGQMDFEGSYIYIYRLDLYILWARTELINNACITRLFVHICTGLHREKGLLWLDAAVQPAAVPDACYITSSWFGYHTILAPFDFPPSPAASSAGCSQGSCSHPSTRGR